MAKKPRKPCGIPGCGVLTNLGNCEKHTRKWHFNKHRPNAGARGYGSTWRKTRDVFIRENPLCKHCNAKGIIRLATDVDHIIPHRGKPELFWQEGNLQSLCKSCHSIKTAKGL